MKRNDLFLTFLAILNINFNMQGIIKRYLNDGVKGFVWPVQDEGVYQDSYKVEGDVYLLGLSVEINF